MQSREKILLFIFLIISTTSGIRYALSNFNTKDVKADLPVYELKDLTKYINSNDLINLTEIDIEDDQVINFFNKQAEEIEITMLDPILDEIIIGPNGYAAIINGNFYIENEYVGGYLIKKINEDNVVLEMEEKSLIIRR